MNPLKAESFLWLGAEEVREIDLSVTGAAAPLREPVSFMEQYKLVQWTSIFYQNHVGTHVFK